MPIEKMLKNMVKLKVEEIKERLVPLFNEEGLQLVLLFGSVVSGKVYPKSDIDLGFLFDRPIDILLLTNRVIQLLRTDKVDVVDLSRASPLLKYSAVRLGKVLFEKKTGFFNNFQSITYRIYFDTKKLRDAQEKVIHNFLGERGAYMRSIEIEIVRRKLALIIENLKNLEPIEGMSQEEYLKDLYKRKATERLLQELFEAAIDINIHMIIEKGHTAPDDYYESFIKAGELKIISSDLAHKLAPSAGLRNRLVHEYDRLDHSMILKALRMAKELYSKYIQEISDYLSKEM
ncbi:MAG: type VII toxin-antitoxin system HepT family RNase toxin [Thermodesulfobacteriota bacterium]